MNIKGLRIFVYVMEEGTLASASRKMNLSQPAASRLLALLEEDLGIALFFREKKRLVPTPPGKLFFPEAVRILASIDGVPDFFQQIRKSATLPLRIVSQPRVVNSQVLPSLYRLLKRRPNLRFTLEVQPRRLSGRLLSLELFDIGVGSLPVPADNLEPRHLFSRRLHVLLPKNHPLAGKQVLETSELTELPYIALEKSTQIRKAVDQALSLEGLSLPPYHEVNVGAVAYQLVRDGIGFTFSDTLAVDVDLRGELCFVPWAQSASLDYGVFLPKTVNRHPAIDDFVECLQESVREAEGIWQVGTQ